MDGWIDGYPKVFVSNICLLLQEALWIVYYWLVTYQSSLAPLTFCVSLRFLPVLVRTGRGAQVPAVPPVPGAERETAGGQRSSAQTERGAEGGGGAAGKGCGRGQRSSTLTVWCCWRRLSEDLSVDELLASYCCRGAL